MRSLPTVPQRASDKVYSMLRKEIDAGRVQAGQRLLEVDVAARFDVSRTPVREALIRLAREGVLERAERGFALPRDDLASFAERLDARRLLDVEIARRAAASAAVDAKALEDRIQRAAFAHAAGRARDFATAHYELRDAIRALAGNSLLARCAVLIDDSFRVGRERLYRVGANREMTLEADRRLVAAIVAGDADTAAAVTLGFLDAVAQLGTADVPATTQHSSIDV